MKKKSKTGIFVLTKLPRMLLIMKSIVILLFCTLNLQAAVYSQQQKKFDISLNNVTVSDVFRYLHEVSQYDFVYDSDAVKQMQPVSVDLQNTDIESVLNTVLAGTPFGWSIEDNVIIIRRNEQPTPSAQQQSKVLKGKVTDKQGNTLPGVTILIKGTTIGNITDANGEFNFEIPDMGNIVLVFSFVGMKPQEVAYTGQTTLKVVMEEETTEMDEVVVTGIFERKTESFTGSASTYKTEDLKMMGSQNLIQSLRTLDPSFHITPNNEFGSDPNKLPDIDIRGKTSIVNLGEEYETDPNQPLFILDGFEVDLQTIVDLNMERIASVTILKDAASTAIYGSRAANGVIVVETKRPEPGTLRLSYNGDFQVQMPDLSDYNMMNAAEKLEFERLTGYYDKTSGNPNVDHVDRWNLYYQRLKNVQSGVDTYWLSEPVRTGFTHKHNLYIEGGDDAMLYGVGISYSGTQGVMKKSGNDILSFNIDLRYRKGALRFDNKFTLDYTVRQNNPVSFSEFVNANPYYPKDYEGETPKYLEDLYIDNGVNHVQVVNPLYNYSLNYLDGSKGMSIRDNFQIEWRPKDGWMARGRISINKGYTNTEVFKSPFHSDFDETNITERGSYTKSSNDKWGYDGDITLTYGQLLGGVHQINAVAGWNFSSSTSTNDSYTAIGFPDDEVPYPAFANQYPETGKPSYSESTSRSTSFYLNANYAYDNRYLLDVNFREDGSSVFGTNKRFTGSWSVGVAWNIHNEEWVGDWANWIKLRFSVGNPGNQNFTAYKAYTTYVYNPGLQNHFGLGVNVSGWGNPNLEWQKTMDYNLGFDLTILNERLKITTDFYFKDTDPMLITTNVAPSTGYDSFVTNLGGQHTKGMSFNLSATVMQNMEEQFSWVWTFNGRTQKQTYRNIGSSLDELNEQLRETSLVRYQDGGSPTDIWAVRSAGIDPMTGEEIYIKKDGTYSFDYDINDEVVIGNSEPKLEGVIGTSVYWKGFSLSANFRYRLKADNYNSELYNRIENMALNDMISHNQDKRALYDRWQEPGDIAQYKRITDVFYGETSNSHMTSRYLQKENTLSGESISLSYQFGEQAWLKKVHLQNMTIRANMNDLFYFSTVKEERGTSYPFARTVSFTVNMTF